MPTETMRSNGPVDVAIVLQQESRRPAQVLFRGAGVRDLQLFGRQRDAGDVGAGHLGEIEAKPAPARADVEHAVAAPDQELCGEMALLGELGVVERRVRRLEIGAAILLVGVEEERIEPPVEIVVVRDIARARPRRLNCLTCRDQIAQPPLQLGPARQHVGLIQQDRQRIGDRAVLDDELPSI